MSPPGALKESHDIGRAAVRVRVVAHASPRWRGARDARDADARNLELSQRRADATAHAVKAWLRRRLGPLGAVGGRDAGASSPKIDVDVSTAVQPGAASVISEHHGSLDTLAEARGDRASDDPRFRRVDVIVDWARKARGQTIEKRAPLMQSTLSRQWKLSVDVSAGGSLGAAAGMLAIRLFNVRSGQSMVGHIFVGGGGPKASLGASKSVWGDPTPFTTEDPVTFEDFADNWVRYATIGVSVFIGYEAARFSFSGMGDGAKDIDVGGWNVGTAGLGGAVTTGSLTLEGSYPPTQIPIPGSEKFLKRYARTTQGGDLFKLTFSTGSAMPIHSELLALEEFLEHALPPL